MYGLVFVLGAFAILSVAVSSQDLIIHPTYRPPPSHHQVIYRKVREAVDLKPLPGNVKPSSPIIYDDVKMDSGKRYARSLSTPGTARASGSRQTSTANGGKSHDTGATHPGYNRRNAREAVDEPVHIRWPAKDGIHPSTYADINVDPSVSYTGSTRPFVGAANPSNHARITRSAQFPTLPIFNPRPSWLEPYRPQFPRPQRLFPIYV